MIRINLLPPEFRRRRTSAGISKESLVIAGGTVLCLVAAAAYVHVAFQRLPAALKGEKKLIKTLAEVKATADEVRKIDIQITGFHSRLKTLQELDATKVCHAELLFDFAQMLANTKWDGQDLEVACTGLSVAPGGQPGGRGGDGGAGATCQFSWGYQMLGRKFEDVGEYINAFYRTIENSPFWKKHRFQGKPSDNYTGDAPQKLSDIERMMLTGRLEHTWQPVAPPSEPAPKEGG